jgi:hypothetical protein
VPTTRFAASIALPPRTRARSSVCDGPFASTAGRVARLASLGSDARGVTPATTVAPRRPSGRSGRRDDLNRGRVAPPVVGSPRRSSGRPAGRSGRPAGRVARRGRGRPAGRCRPAWSPAGRDLNRWPQPRSGRRRRGQVAAVAAVRSPPSRSVGSPVDDLRWMTSTAAGPPPPAPRSPSGRRRGRSGRRWMTSTAVGSPRQSRPTRFVQ